MWIYYACFAILFSLVLGLALWCGCYRNRNRGPATEREPLLSSALEPDAVVVPAEVIGCVKVEVESSVADDTLFSDTENPEKDTENPEKDTENPEKDTKNPEKDTENPEKDAENAEKDNENPESETLSSDDASGSPETELTSLPVDSSSLDSISAPSEAEDPKPGPSGRPSSVEENPESPPRNMEYFHKNILLNFQKR